MTEEEFTEKYESEKYLYKNWGNYVKDSIISQIIKPSFQIEPKVRIKEINSLIGKAFYRNKPYEDPYLEITDKVGLRFVVLLSSEIFEINNIIENTPEWNFSRDRDFEQERLHEPLAFDYQSMHYILTSNTEISYNDVTIPIGITCEVQIRTLLQHAYSELSHSRIYKPSFDPDAKVKRVVAKSMALLETTDEYFEEVNNRMNEIAAFNILEKLTQLLDSTVEDNIVVSQKSNYFIMDTFAKEITEESSSLSDVEDLKSIVKSNYSNTYLNTQPIIFFLYYMILNKKALLLEKWPLPKEELRPLFNQLGIAINDLG